MAERDYIIDIDPKILKFLGPSLYTNIYYVLAELIANSWDADATEVFIIDKGDALIVEDNGNGMSYKNGDVDGYLKVAEETRSDESQSKTKGGRLKMGRKGVGKLSALAASSLVRVLTIKEGEKSGFILTRDIDSTGRLQEIPESEIHFERVDGDNGTSIQMLNPEYKMNRSLDVISRNITKLFPVISSSFKITIINKNGDEITISDFDQTIIPDLAALITLGDDFNHLQSLYVKVDGIDNNYTKTEPSKIIPLVLKDKTGNEKEYQLEIKGWIGAYRSTKNRRVEQLEFPDNYLSIYSRGKIGEFNVIPRIGTNRLQEVYVVGQLHIDLFEETSLPDMALSNRQGYRDDDLRYIKAMEYAETLLKEIINLRVAWSDENSKAKKKEKIDELRAKEEAFKENVDTFKSEVAKRVSEKINAESVSPEEVAETVKSIINESGTLLGLKPTIDTNKKRILISQTSLDKDLADIVYEMLIYNNISKEDIIYSSCDDEECRIPDGYPIYDYLRDFFVESYSNEKMYVIYITSKKMSQSWGSVVEVGASWITKMDHKIFNINCEDEVPFSPLKPLNVEVIWQQTFRNNKNELSMNAPNADNFCTKIETICKDLGIEPKTRAENIAKLRKLVLIG